MSGPRTAAGRTLLKALPNSFPPEDWWAAHIVAIEAEARNQERKQIADMLEQHDADSGLVAAVRHVLSIEARGEIGVEAPPRQVSQPAASTE